MRHFEGIFITRTIKVKTEREKHNNNRWTWKCVQRGPRRHRYLQNARWYFILSTCWWGSHAVVTRPGATRVSACVTHEHRLCCRRRRNGPLIKWVPLKGARELLARRESMNRDQATLPFIYFYYYFLPGVFFLYSLQCAPTTLCRPWFPTFPIIEKRIDQCTPKATVRFVGHFNGSPVFPALFYYFQRKLVKCSRIIMKVTRALPGSARKGA